MSSLGLNLSFTTDLFRSNTFSPLGCLDLFIPTITCSGPFDSHQGLSGSSYQTFRFIVLRFMATHIFSFQLSFVYIRSTFAKIYPDLRTKCSNLYIFVLFFPQISRSARFFLIKLFLKQKEIFSYMFLFVF